MPEYYDSSRGQFLDEGPAFLELENATQIMTPARRADDNDCFLARVCNIVRRSTSRRGSSDSIQFSIDSKRQAAEIFCPGAVRALVGPNGHHFRDRYRSWSNHGAQDWARRAVY